jgi:hypothetical protein
MKTRLLTLAVLAAGVAQAAGAQTISYPDFSSTAGLQINGNASQQGNKLRLTPATYYQGGSAFSQTTVPLASNASFSTVFSFEILGRGGLDNGADGLTFTVQTNANNVGGVGGGIGYQGLANSVAVEFDTYNNGEFGGSNHVGINTNGNMSSIVSSPFLPIDFDNAATWWAWVDYDGSTQQMDVRWAQSSSRPAAAMLSAAGLNLATILGNSNVYVGFTAGTGAGYGEHNITSWNFVNTFQNGGAPLPTVTPEPASIVLMATGLGLVGLGVRRKRKQ